jgi:hypothetical protein
MQQRLESGKPFLWLDESSPRQSRIHSVGIVVEPAGGQTPQRVRGGLVHHWMSAVFIPEARLDDTLAVVRNYENYTQIYQPAVAASKAIDTSEAEDHFSIVLLNKSFFANRALDADYTSCYLQIDSRRAYSISQTTRVQQMEHYGAAGQRLLGEGEGDGIIWRLFSITRYEERDRGVYVELEAIALSRDVPASLRWMVDPLVRRVSRSSLTLTLQQTADAVSGRTQPVIEVGRNVPRACARGIRFAPASCSEKRHH